MRIRAPGTVEAVVTDDPATRTLRVHFLAYNAPPQTMPRQNRPSVLPALIEDTPCSGLPSPCARRLGRCSRSIVRREPWRRGLPSAPASREGALKVRGPLARPARGTASPQPQPPGIARLTGSSTPTSPRTRLNSTPPRAGACISGKRPGKTAARASSPENNETNSFTSSPLFAYRGHKLCGRYRRRTKVCRISSLGGPYLGPHN